MKIPIHSLPFEYLLDSKKKNDKKTPDSISIPKKIEIYKSNFSEKTFQIIISAKFLNTK